MIDDLYRLMNEIEMVDAAMGEWEPTCWVCDGYHEGRGCPVDSEPRGDWFGYEDSLYY